MYEVPPPREPSGCVQSLVISRMIFQILLVPILLILGAIIAVLLMLWALSESPFLALAIVIVAALVLVALARWEARRIKREMQEDE